MRPRIQERQLFAFGRREGQRQLRPEQRRAGIGELGVIAGRAHFGAQPKHPVHRAMRRRIAKEAGARILQRHIGICLWPCHRQRIAGAIGDPHRQGAQPGARLCRQPFDHIAVIAAARQRIGGREGPRQRQRQPAVIVAADLRHQPQRPADLGAGPAQLAGSEQHPAGIARQPQLGGPQLPAGRRQDQIVCPGGACRQGCHGQGCLNVTDAQGSCL